MRYLTLSFFCTLALSFQARAQPMRPDALPVELKGWANWVLFDRPIEQCPFLNGSGTHRCAWPGRLDLSLDTKSGQFTQRFTIFREGWMTLPGDSVHWPQEVKVDGKPALVVPASEAPEESQDETTEEQKETPNAASPGSPMVKLTVGEHTVSGRFLYDVLPESLAAPTQTGLISLTVRQKDIFFPQRDEEGRIFLSAEDTEQSDESIDLDVHRKIIDDIPLTLSTRIVFKISGKSREVVLSKALPDAFIPTALTSTLPARLESDGRLRVQVRPGEYTLTLEARAPGVVKSIARPQVNGAWIDGDELWVFESRPSLRQVEVAGVAAIDATQTTLPTEWKSLPAYAISVNDTVSFDEKRRGDSDPAADTLSLSRRLWLDFDGAGLSVNDKLSGQLRRTWRLEVQPGIELGRALAGGADQSVTRLSAQAQPGVELRQGLLNLEADSRVSQFGGTLSAVSWDADFNAVSAELNVPPGWKVLHVSGADNVPGTWLSRWRLLDIFLVLVIALAFGRLFGTPFGLLALLTLSLSWQEPSAPNYLWLAVLFGEALYRVLPDGKVRFTFALYRYASWATLLIVAITFMVSDVRHGMYPALAKSRQLGGIQSYSDYSRENVEQLARNSSGEDDSKVQNMRKDLSFADEEPTGMLEAAAEAIGAANSISPPEPTVSHFANQVPPPPAPPPQQGSWNGSTRIKKRSQNVRDYDKNAVVQTGFGLPRWQWERLSIGFSGPVQRAQQLRLFLLSPSANFALAWVRVLLLALMVLCVFQFPGRFWPQGLRRQFKAARPLTTALTLLLSGLSLSASAAEIPDQQKLSELRERLLKAPSCAPECASIPRVFLEASAQTLKLRVEVLAAAATAVPLPGNAQQWTPRTVSVDGKPAAAMFRDEEGTVWAQVNEGVHQLLLEGPLPERDTVQIPLPLKAYRVESRLTGWRLDGVHEDGLADESLQLSRESTNQKGRAASMQTGTLPPFVRVVRTLQLDLNWSVSTQVIRTTPLGSAVVLEVPLLQGESVTSSEVRVVNKRALVNMPANATEFSWTSVLENKSPIALTAPATLDFVEEWNLDVSPVWHMTLSGIPVIHQQDLGAARVPQWRPWPGEQVSIAVARPESVQGQTVTIDQSQMSIVPGARATDVTFTANLRSSRGGQHSFSIPEGALLRGVTINGKQQPIAQSGRTVSIPLAPGSQSTTLTWRQDNGWTTYWTTPPLELNLPTVNAELLVNAQNDRWILFAGGPRMGPAVLFWSYLLVLLLVSIAFSRIPFSPLSTLQWTLLAVGLSQVPIVATAFVFGWMLFLGFRSKSTTVSAGWFNLRQVAIAGVTFIALCILAVSVYEGLLGQPEMQITGNGSSLGSLRWFADRSPSLYPTAFVISVPMLVYRAAMLAWSLWMAIRLLQWLKFGWNAFSAGGLWKQTVRPPPFAAKQPAPDISNS